MPGDGITVWCYTKACPEKPTIKQRKSPLEDWQDGQEKRRKGARTETSLRCLRLLSLTSLAEAHLGPLAGPMYPKAWLKPLDTRQLQERCLEKLKYKGIHTLPPLSRWHTSWSCPSLHILLYILMSQGSFSRSSVNTHKLLIVDEKNRIRQDSNIDGPFRHNKGIQASYDLVKGDLFG